MDLGVRGKAYVLVGGSRGMGWETARILAQEGARVGIVSRNPAGAEAEARALAQATGAEVCCFGADVTRPGEVEEAIGAAIARFGVVRGLLVTNGSTSHNGTTVEMTEEDWQINFNDVLMGSVRACRAMLPHLEANGGGSIVLTSAMSARISKGWLVGYASLKAALINLTKNIAKQHGPRGVRANCVCPGAIETERSRARIDALVAERALSREDAGRALLDERMGLHPALERIGQAHEVADMMAFMLSERAAYMTGAIVPVDGGSDF